jgi:hypothetical protein
MKSIIRTVLFGGLLMLALSGIATASASAAECPGTGEGVVLCSGGHVQEGTFAFTGKKTVGNNSEYEVQGIMKIFCGISTSKGQFVATKGHVEITNLVIDNPSCYLTGTSCKVKPLIFGIAPGLKGVLTGTTEIELSPMSGTQFAEISVSECEHEYQAKVTGSQKCQLALSTIEAVTHEEICTASGSKLHAGTKQVVIEFAEEIKLSSGAKFSLQHG